MHEIKLDQNRIYTKLSNFLKPYFPGCVLYAHGSRVERNTCNKCDFDIIIWYSPGQPQLVKFLQEVKVYDNRSFKKLALERLKGRLLTGDAYFRFLFQLYTEHINYVVEHHFKFLKDEFGNDIKVDLMTALMPLSKHKPVVRLL